MAAARSIEERFDAQQVIAMAQRLPVREIEALGEATELREAGLRAARSGDLVTGHQLIGSARVNRDRIVLSDEAATMFETYQHAAEAYLDYREGRYAAATAAMEMAIVEANRLRASYGYIVELRRIHLAANLLRIAVSSEAYNKAADDGLRLVRYLRGEKDAWPWPALGLKGADVLPVDSLMFVLSQVMRPLAAALMALSFRAAPSYAHEALAHEEALQQLTAIAREDAVNKAIAQWAAELRANRKTAHGGRREQGGAKTEGLDSYGRV